MKGYRFGSVTGCGTGAVGAAEPITPEKDIAGIWLGATVGKEADGAGALAIVAGTDVIVGTCCAIVGANDASGAEAAVGTLCCQAAG